MPACPVCHPWEVLSADAAPHAADAGLRASVPPRLALAVLVRRPTLTIPSALAAGTTAVVATWMLSRIQLGLFWTLDILMMWVTLMICLAGGFVVLTFARSAGVAATIHHLDGADHPLLAGSREVARRIGSVIPWLFMHGVTAVVHGVSLLGNHEVGAASVGNSQYVWQVMFGEDAGLGRAMDRSVQLVRAGVRGSGMFSSSIGAAFGLLGGGAMLWLAGKGVAAGVSVPWALVVVVVTIGVALWATLADIMDTVAWRQAHAGGLGGSASPPTPTPPRPPSTAAGGSSCAEAGHRAGRAVTLPRRSPHGPGWGAGGVRR